MSSTAAAPSPRPAGHALVEALIAQGVHTCFGVPGESYLAVLDGFHEFRDRIRFIACRQAMKRMRSRNSWKPSSTAR